MGRLDNNAIHFTELSSYARFKATVQAYNEKYKVEPKP